MKSREQTIADMTGVIFNKDNTFNQMNIGEVISISELEIIGENKREEIEREINIKKLDVTVENLPGS